MRIRYLPILPLTCPNCTHWCALRGTVERRLAARKRPAQPDHLDANYRRAPCPGDLASSQVLSTVGEAASHSWLSIGWPSGHSASCCLYLGRGRARQRGFLRVDPTPDEGTRKTEQGRRAPLEAKVVLDRYRGPLLDAAWQLGDRVDNIRNRGFFVYLSEGSGRAPEARRTTLFRFAYYLGWREYVRIQVRCSPG